MQFCERLDGVKQLELRDFSVGAYGKTRLRHPEFIGKNGMILIYSKCNNCSNNSFKNTWSNLAMTMGDSFPIGSFCTEDGNYVRESVYYVRKDGLLELYKGKKDIHFLTQYIINRQKN